MLEGESRPMAFDQLDSFGFHSRMLHSPGRPLVGGRNSNREQIGAVAVSFGIGASEAVGVACRLDSGRVGTGVQPLQGENYMYSRVLGHVQLWI